MRSRRAFRHHRGEATFYADTLFLCLESDAAASFERLTSEMPQDLAAAERALRSGQRDRALPVLTRHCHEFVHYHQFAGTNFGLVFRRLLAARTRLREQVLLQLDPKALRAMLGSETGGGPLIRIEATDRIVVHPIVRANADSYLVATLCWLDAFESYLLDGSYAELFTSTSRTAAVLDAIVEWTRWDGRFAPSDLLAKLEAEPDAAPDQVPQLFPIEPICEAQATINERALLELQGGNTLAESMRIWTDGRDRTKQFVVRDRVEILRQVGVHHVGEPLAQQSVH